PGFVRSSPHPSSTGAGSYSASSPRTTVSRGAQAAGNYVGRAGPRKRVMVSELADRVTEYCTTPLGARSPHAGGWPLKTLANLHEVAVHFAYCATYILGSRCALVDATQRRLAPRRRMRPWAQLPSQYSCAVDQASRAAIRPVALASRSPCSKWMPP